MEDKVRLEAFRNECQKAVEKAKSDYLNHLGNKLNDTNTPQKLYWKIISKVLNKCRAPKIPPLLINNEFIVNCKEKAKHFNRFFSDQCKLVQNNSTIPFLYYHADKRISDIAISSEKILSLIRCINPKKANGPDNISGHMIRIADESIVLPLKLIFTNIMKTSIYPTLWKLANVTPVFKKKRQTIDKQLPTHISYPCMWKVI